MMQNNLQTIKLFNTPLEIGLRCLVILNNSAFFDIDKEHIMFLDYLSLNTGDLGGPSSIHAPIPNRGVQVYARKDLIQKGLKIMISKGLISVKAEKSGFLYSITDNGVAFLKYFQSEYYLELVERINWISEKFKNCKSSELKKYIDQNLEHWGGEFVIAQS